MAANPDDLQRNATRLGGTAPTIAPDLIQDARAHFGFAQTAPAADLVQDVRAHFGFAPQPTQPPPAPGFAESLGRSAKAMTGAGIASLGTVLEDVGAPDLGQPVRQYGESIQQANPSAIQTMGDIVAKPRAFLGEAAGQLAAQLPVSAAGAFTGARLGAMAGGLAGPAGAAVGGVLGGIGGAFVPNVTMEYGEARANQRDTGLDDKGRALTAALPAAALDTAGELFAARKVLKPLFGKAAGVALPVTEYLPQGASRLGNIAKQAGQAAIVEGATEIPQTALERWGGGMPLATPDALNEYGISAAMGAVGGGLVGGAGGAMQPRAQPGADIPPTPTVTGPQPTPAGLPPVAPEQPTLGQPFVPPAWQQLPPSSYAGAPDVATLPNPAAFQPQAPGFDPLTGFIPGQQPGTGVTPQAEQRDPATAGGDAGMLGGDRQPVGTAGATDPGAAVAAGLANVQPGMPENLPVVDAGPAAVAPEPAAPKPATPPADGLASSAGLLGTRPGLATDAPEAAPQPTAPAPEPTTEEPAPSAPLSAVTPTEEPSWLSPKSPEKAAAARSAEPLTDATTGAEAPAVVPAPVLTENDQNNVFRITNVDALGGAEAVRGRLREAGIAVPGTQETENTLRFHRSLRDKIQAALTPQPEQEQPNAQNPLSETADAVPGSAGPLTATPEQPDPNVAPGDVASAPDAAGTTAVAPEITDPTGADYAARPEGSPREDVPGPVAALPGTADGPRDAGEPLTGGVSGSLDGGTAGTVAETPGQAGPGGDGGVTGQSLAEKPQTQPWVEAADKGEAWPEHRWFQSRVQVDVGNGQTADGTVHNVLRTSSGRPWVEVQLDGQDGTVRVAPERMSVLEVKDSQQSDQAPGAPVADSRTPVAGQEPTVAPEESSATAPTEPNESDLTDVGLLRQWRDRWQYKTSPTGGWLIANSKDSALQSAKEVWSKTPPEQLLTREQRFTQANEELYADMDAKYGKKSLPELEAEIRRMDAQIARLWRDDEFDGQGSRRTGAAVSNEGARQTGEAKLLLGTYLKMRQEREATQTLSAQSRAAPVNDPATHSGESPQWVEHTTAKGKTLRGVVRNDLTAQEARRIDPFMFKKDGGFFIREKFAQNAAEPAPAGVDTGATVPAPTPTPQTVGEVLQARADERPRRNAAKLRQTAGTLLTRAQAAQDADRNTNTARRASMAASALNSAAQDEALAKTMTNLADAIENGQAQRLAGINSKAAIEALDGVLRDARTRYEGVLKLPYEQSKQRRSEPYAESEFQHVGWPDTTIRSDWVPGLVGKLNAVRGGKKLIPEVNRQQLTPDLYNSLVKVLGKRETESAVGWLAVRNMQDITRLQRAGIQSTDDLQAAVREFAQLKAGKASIDPVKAAEMALAGQKVGIDYFPTPQPLAARMADVAGIEPGMKVLEPSAGKGSLADAARAKGAEVDTVEVSEALRKVLEAKGYPLVGHDFEDYQPGAQYDRIIMNPPFGKGTDRKDAAHIMRAYDLLKPGGKLVAIAGEGVFFGTDKAATQFRNWLDEHGGSAEKLPDGSFLDRTETHTTGTAARMVVLEKPAVAPDSAMSDVAPVQPSAPATILQNRDRSTPAAIQQMQSIAAQPDYIRLGPSRDFANGAPVVAGGQIQERQMGREETTVTASGRRIPTRYAVVEASALLPSNQADGSVNAAYGDAATPATRAIAGNGRVAGLQKAYVQGTAKDYRAELVKDAASHGIKPGVINMLRQPVLVRVMAESDVTPNIGDESNIAGTLTLSPVEQAQNDAARIALDGIAFDDDGVINRQAVTQFVRAMPTAEQGGLIDSNGQPTRQAYDRLNAAVFHKAYGDEELVRLHAQAVDPEARLVMSALAKVAPKMAKLEGAGALDIRSIVAEAGKMLVNGRRRGLTVQQVAQQLDLDTDPNVGEVLRLFAENPRSNKAVIEALANVADFAHNEAFKPDADMFEAVPRATRQDVLNRLRNDHGRSSQADMAQSGRGEPVPVDAPQGTADRGSTTSAATTDSDLFPAADAATRAEADRLALIEAQKEQQRKSNATQAPPADEGIFALDNRQADLADTAGEWTGGTTNRPRFGSGAVATLSQAEQELRELAHADERPGDVLLGNGQYVAFDAVMQRLREGVDSGAIRPVPAQVHMTLDVAMRDVDRLLEALDGVPTDAPQFSRSSTAPNNALTYEYAVPPNNPRAAPIDKAALRALRRDAVRLEDTGRAITFQILDDGRAVVRGPARVKVPKRFQRFADQHGLTLVVRRGASAHTTTPMPDAHRESGALYFGEILDSPVDAPDTTWRNRDGKTRFKRATDNAPQSPPLRLPLAANQAKAEALNRSLARQFKNNAWNTAYVQRDLPESLAEFAAAAKAAFDAEVIGITATNPRFDQFNGINVGGRHFVNLNANVGFVNVTGHEILHQLKRERPDLYHWFALQARGHYQNFAEYQDRLNSLLQAGETRFNKAAAEEELLADLTGDLLADPAFVQRLAEASPSKFKQLLNAVIKWLKQAADKLMQRGLGSSDYFRDIETLREHLAQALVAYAEGGTAKLSKLQGPKFHQAWHGSIHLFDRFSLSKAQSVGVSKGFGHGLYFSDVRFIADLYRGTGGKPGGGRLYQVDLAPQADEYMDYFKPLSQQSEKVRAALASLGFGDDPRATGEAVYNQLAASTGSQPNASAALHQAGVRGIRYPAEGSINKGKSNYVLFSDTDVTITAKFSRSAKGTITVDGVERPTTNSNGQPIHPTEEGMRNFWRWFGDSRVVDDQGRPLVVYHGGPTRLTDGREGIKAFSKAKLGWRTGASSAEHGFFFSDSAAVADSYNSADVLNSPLGGPAHRVDVAQAELEKWLDGVNLGEAVWDEDEQGYVLQITEYTQFGDENTYEWGVGVYFDTEQEALAAFGTDVVPTAIAKAEKELAAAEANLDRYVKEQIISGGATVYPVYLNITDPLRHDFKGGNYEDQSFTELMEEAKDDELDGVLLKNVRDDYEGKGIPSNVWVAFDPTQIKSAIGNTGAFSPDTPDIRFSRAYTPEQQAVKDKYAEGQTLHTKTLRQRVEESVDHWQTAWAQKVVDRYRSFRDVLKDPELWKQARLAAQSEGAVVAAMHFGAPAWDASGAIKTDLSATPLDKLNQTLGGEINDFLIWVAAQRADRINRKADAAADMVQILEQEIEDLPTQLPDRPTQKHRDAIQAKIAQAERDLKAAKRAARIRERFLDEDTIAASLTFDQGTMVDGRDRAQVYRQAAEDFNRLNDAFVALNVESGTISAEDAERWRSEGVYVPFYRFLQDEDGTARRRGLPDLGSLDAQTAFKQYKGSAIPLNDLLSNVLGNWHHLAHTATHNAAAVKALDLAVDMGLAERVPEAQATDRSLWVRQDGRKVYYNQIGTGTDAKLVWEALEGMHYTGWQSPAIQLMSKFSQLLRAGVTASPVYRARNLIRDSIQALATSNVSQAPGRAVLDGWKATQPRTMQELQAFADMVSSGALFGIHEAGYLREGNPASANAKALLKLGSKPDRDGAILLRSWDQLSALWDKYQAGGARLENVNRAAAFRKTFAETGSLLDAAFEANDLMPFQMRGTSHLLFNMARVVPFFNSRLQGLDKLARSAIDENTRKQFVTVTGAYIGLSLLAYMALADDDDYKELEDWRRDSYHYFKVGGQLYKIPRPFEMGVLATMAERTLEQFMRYGEVPKTLWLDRLYAALGDTLSINPIPQAMQPMLDVYANRDSFTGRPIEGMGMERLSKADRKTPDSSYVGVGMAQGLDAVFDTLTFGRQQTPLSPVQIDSLIEGYMGWLGALALAGSNLVLDGLSGAPDKPADIRAIPIVGDFVRAFSDADIPRSTAYSSLFYDHLRVVQQAQADLNHARRMGDSQKVADLLKDKRVPLNLKGAYNKAASDLSDINRRMQAIRVGPQDGAAKRAQLDRLQTRKNQLTETIERRFGRMLQ